MPVRVQQRDDGMSRTSIGANGTERLVQRPDDGASWTDQQLIDWKQQMHEAQGWTCSRQQGGRRIVCTKNYAPAPEYPNAPTIKERTFRII